MTLLSKQGTGRPEPRGESDNDTSWQRPMSGPGSLGYAASALAIMLMIFDYFTGFNGLNIDIVIRNLTFGFVGGGDIASNPLIRMLWGIQFWVIMIIWAVFRKHNPDVPFLRSFPRVGAAVLVVLFIGLSGGLFSASGLAHMLMAVAFNFLILERVMPFRRAREVAIYFLLADFIGYGVLEYFTEFSPVLQLFSNRIVVPIYLYGIFYFWSDYEKKAGVALMGLLLFNLFIIANAVLFPAIKANAVEFDTAQQRLEAMIAVGTAWDNVKLVVSSGVTSLKQEFGKGIDEATGGYSKSKNPDDQDPNTRLGVYLENVEPAQKQFTSAESVEIFGDFHARTLDLEETAEPIQIALTCSGVNDKGVKKTITVDDVETKIVDFEEIPFVCAFAPGDIKMGSSSVDVESRFRFSTFSVYDTHLMDVERVRKIRAENKDPLTVERISEKNPIATPTSGPIKLGISTTEPPMRLNLEPGAETKAIVGATLERFWVGEIAAVHDLEVTLPAGFVMTETEGKPCRGEFEIKEDSAIDFGEGKMLMQKTYKLVKETKNKGIEKIKLPVVTHVSWSCPITLTAEAAKIQLGEATSVTRRFEAWADYDFRVVKKVPVYVKIEKVASEKKTEPAATPAATPAEETGATA